jgi:hypothetical protein
MADTLLVPHHVKMIAITAATLAAAGACADQPERGTGSYIESHVESYDFPGSVPTDVDLLFVVDDTAAMSPYTARVKSLATSLDTALSQTGGALPNLHMAVITANAATVSFRQPAGTSDPFIYVGVDAHFDPASNVSGPFSALEAMLDVGTAGTAAVAPLQAAKLALDAEPAFLRDNSYLGIITVAASDDASPSAVDAYVTALKASRSDPTMVIATGAFPQPAARLDAFHASFPNRSEVVDADSADWTDVMSIYSQLVRYTLGVPCIIQPADLDALTPGGQYDCALGAYYSDGTSEALPQCSDGGPDRCFDVVPDPINCVGGNYGELEVRGYPGHYRPTIRGQCVVEGP